MYFLFFFLKKTDVFKAEFYYFDEELLIKDI
jgi:hypothetical protein